jgi:hypothetical protein
MKKKSAPQQERTRKRERTAVIPKFVMFSSCSQIGIESRCAMASSALDAVMPKTVAELKGFTVAVHCAKCGRTVPIDPVRLNSAGGRAVDRAMPLPRFMARLRCTERMWRRA